MAKRVVAVVDVNVLLHCQWFEAFPWVRVLEAAEVELLFTATVLDELNTRAQATVERSKRVRERAKATGKRLADLLTAGESPPAIARGVVARFGDREPHEEYRRLGLEPQQRDDAYLLAALKLREAGEDVVLLTGDDTLRVRAFQRKVPCRQPPDDVRKLEEEDESAKRVRELEAELLRVARPRLSVRVQRRGAGERLQPLRVGVDDFTEARRLAHHLCAAQRRWAEMQEDLDAQSSVLIVGRPSWRTSANDYRAALEAFVSVAEEYQRWLVRTVGVTLVIENEGDAPALNVGVQVLVPSSGTSFESVTPSPRAPPQLPRDLREEHPGSALESLGHFAPDIPLGADLLGGQLRLDRDASLPTGTRLEFKAERIAQRQAIELPSLYFEFSETAGVRPFQLTVTLLADNMAGVQTVPLNIVAFPPQR